jgi:hypothetical protein
MSPFEASLIAQRVAERVQALQNVANTAGLLAKQQGAQLQAPAPIFVPNVKTAK